ncbi:MAG: hypothetical protein F4Y74_04605 [Gemmatimonadales bacterium]|nr:hypothetical protein [Gemmatimonadales bacterium]MYG20357.1 hypothetical protein [Gemmatimonadales bacterium]
MYWRWRSSPPARRAGVRRRPHRLRRRPPPHLHPGPPQRRPSPRRVPPQPAPRYRRRPRDRGPGRCSSTTPTSTS